MSLPFHKRKRDAEALWGKGVKLRRVWVEGGRFLQAREDGYYWVNDEYAKKLKLRRHPPKSRSKRR